MANENVLAPAPIRSDDQILPVAAWVPIGKSNYVLDLQKKQKNPIFQISVDILQNTNFFRAFTTSTSVPAIYIQQFWNTLTYEVKSGVYSFKLDETRFILDANLLREALEITPIDQAHQFVSPPLGEAIMDFVNELGYTEGFITSSNVDYAELMWEEFVQAIQTFLTDKENLGKSPFHLAEDDLRLGMHHTTMIIWKWSQSMIRKLHPKRKERRNLQAPSNPSQSQLLRSQAKPSFEKSSKPAPAPKPKVTKEKSSKASTAKPPKSKPAKEKSTKATPLQKAGKGKVAKVCKVKSTFQLVDEPDEEPAHSKPEPEQEDAGEEYDMERVIQMSLESIQAQGHAHVRGVAIQEPVAEAIRQLHRRSTTDQFIFQRRTPSTEEATTRSSAQPQDDTSANIIRDSPSPTDAETGVGSDKTSSGGDTKILQIIKELGEDVEKQVDLEEKTAELDQDQAESDPDETHESRPPPAQVLVDKDQAELDPGITRVALAGPDLESMHDEFMTDLYPKVQESLKFPANEHVLLEDPLSSTETLSLMNNLEDAYSIRDQFINDKSTDDELGKLNVEVEVVSMVTVPIYQASSSVPPLSTPVIDILPPKPASSTTQTPIFIAITTTTITPLLPSPQQQSTTKSELVERAATLEKKLSDLEQTNKNLDNTTQNLRSRVYTLELRDLPHKINEVVRENVKDVVQIALQAPLRDRFRDLSEEDMKKMLHQRMFESGTYKSLPEHIALYEALEALRGDDKTLRASGSSQSPAPQSSTWKTSDTRDVPSSYSKQQSGPHDEQPLKPIPEDDKLATPEPAWVIPTSHIPDAENNLANALATTYQAPAENSLHEKTGDMRTFMNWYCQKMGKTELTQADLNGQAYEVVKAFYPNVVHLQFQMEECKKMLTDQIDWTNPEDDQVRIDINRPLPLSGPPDLNLLLLQGHLNHLPGSDIVVFPVSNNEWKIMWFNEIYKFSDGTLTNIMEALDYIVKKYKVNRLNSGMNTRFWTDKDMERSKEFIHAIKQRLKTRRIFRNLECFVGGRVRDIDYKLLQRTE
ncbi:hypothetical protein Tco_1094626 [Tanacetum coccineum]|uniref:Monodehydroascorbate reductase n=1 Tax=Tanacetum coccineum TaxID=301880 RepID=A0ABQ5IG16_9ASTR